MQAELNRKQSVVFFSDIVGYTRLMEQDENAAFELMKLNLNIHQDVLVKYRGTIIKELGDGILAVFETAPEALRACLEIQKKCLADSKYKLRIGLQSGEIIFDHGDVFGDAVNIAFKHCFFG
jgi:adenylate cyclase